MLADTHIAETTRCPLTIGADTEGTCLHQGCMAWRWFAEPPLLQNTSPGGPQGYCGLAGPIHAEAVHLEAIRDAGYAASGPKRPRKRRTPMSDDIHVEIDPWLEFVAQLDGLILDDTQAPGRVITAGVDVQADCLVATVAQVGPA